MGGVVGEMTCIVHLISIAKEFSAMMGSVQHGVMRNECDGCAQ